MRRTRSSTPQSPPASSYYQPPAEAPLVVHKRLDAMSPLEAVSYTQQLIDRLKNKQTREQDYLNSRRRRGIHTSTDILSEQDQLLEDEILALFAEILEGLRERAAQALP